MHGKRYDKWAGNVGTYYLSDSPMGNALMLWHLCYLAALLLHQNTTVCKLLAWDDILPHFCHSCAMPVTVVETSSTIKGTVALTVCVLHCR